MPIMSLDYLTATGARRTKGVDDIHGGVSLSAELAGVPSPILETFIQKIVDAVKTEIIAVVQNTASDMLERMIAERGIDIDGNSD